MAEEESSSSSVPACNGGQFAALEPESWGMKEREKEEKW